MSDQVGGPRARGRLNLFVSDHHEMRTKQTATKSTGGPAPRRALGDATGSSPEPQAPVAKKRKQAIPGPTQDAELVPFVVGAGSSESDANKWCAGCEDGGFFYECELCKWWMCDRCIAFDSDIDPAAYDFYCPKCWVEHPNKIPSWTVRVKGKKAELHQAGEDVPYQGLFYGGKPTGTLKYTGVQTMRGRWPVCDTRPIAIISVRLNGERLMGDPAMLVGNHLATYYKDRPFLFDTITYDLVAGLDAYDCAIRALTQRIKEHGAQKIIVFLTTHATPEEGLIHTAKGGAAALDPHDVLPRLLPSGLQQLIRAAPISLLVLQGCGALNSGQARTEVMDFVENAGFHQAIGFTAVKYLPTAANTFLQDVLHALCITRHAKKFAQILHTHYELGIHSNVIVYLPTPRRIYRFCWTHPMVRPYSHPVRPQCAKCHHLKPFRIDAPRHTADRLVLVCKGCKHEEVYDRGNLAILGGVWDKKFKGVEGVWYGEWQEGSSASESAPVLDC
ncbi:hypothetical protein FB451DRAFT_1389644 [Mycena latifolia]|nr:hypothetical protein FB451DRAFT_1389644 [Mycena latifolia]